MQEVVLNVVITNTKRTCQTSQVPLASTRYFLPNFKFFYCKIEIAQEIK